MSIVLGIDGICALCGLDLAEGAELVRAGGCTEYVCPPCGKKAQVRCTPEDHCGACGWCWDQEEEDERAHQRAHSAEALG